MHDVEIDNKRFLQELETEVQTGEERARKSKAALKQGTVAADNIEYILAAGQSNSKDKTAKPEPSKKTSKTENLLFPKETNTPKSNSFPTDSTTPPPKATKAKSRTADSDIPDPPPSKENIHIIDVDMSKADTSEKNISSTNTDPPKPEVILEVPNTSLDTNTPATDTPLKDTDTPKKSESFAKQKSKLINRTHDLRKMIENIEVAKDDFRKRIKGETKEVAALRQKNQAPKKIEQELEKAHNAVIKCETELNATKAAVKRIDNMINDIVNSMPLFAAQTGKGNKPVSTIPFSYTVEQYQADIEEAEEPADVIVRNKRHEPIPVYLVDAPKPLVQKGFPDFSRGFWESEQEHAKRKGCSVKTLKKYRETSSGAVRLTEDGIHLRDGDGNILRKINDKQNSPYRTKTLSNS